MDKLFRLKNFFRSGRLRLTPMLLRDFNDYIKKNFCVESDGHYVEEHYKLASIGPKKAEVPAHPEPSEDGRVGKIKEPAEKKPEKEESPGLSSAPSDGIVKDSVFTPHKGAAKLHQEEAQQKKENQEAQPAGRPRGQILYQSAPPKKEEPEGPERKPKGGATYYQSAEPQLEQTSPNETAPAQEERAVAGASFGELPDRKPRIDEFIRQRQQPKFSRLLLSFIDRRGEKDSDVYHRAQLDRRVFSKIRSDEDYHPSRDTVVALALALKLKRSDADELLESAGYALSRSRMSDLTIAFCIEREIFSVSDVNMLLDYYDLPILGKIA